MKILHSHILLAVVPLLSVPSHLAKKRGRNSPANSKEPDQVRREKEVLEKAAEDGLLATSLWPYSELAQDVVRERWIERGIWKGGSTKFVFEVWKHEVADAGLYEAPAEAKKEQHQGSPKLTTTSEVRGIEKLPRPPDIDASRPCNQFKHDLAIEKRRLEAGEAPDGLPDMAYKRLKDIWTERGLWDPRYTQHPEFDLAKYVHYLWARERKNCPKSVVEAEELAHKNVKATWIEDGRWDQRWTDRPGKIWRHEQPEERARLLGLGG